MPYAAYTDVEELLNITLQPGGQALVTDTISALSAYVDSYCNRSWTNASNTDITEYFDGGTNIFPILNPPVATITSMAIVDNAGNSNPVATEDIYNYGSYVKTSYMVEPGSRIVKIVYRTASTALPADLKHAIVRWAAEIFKSQEDAGKTVSSISMGPLSMNYLAKDGIPQFALDVMNRYRLTAGF